MTTDTIFEISKVGGAALVGIALAHTETVKDVLSIISLIVAIAYGLWKWRVDYLKRKEQLNKK